MTIVDARCYRYSLPLKTPLSLGPLTIGDRQGALLRLEGEGGAVGWGDAAPLPGFSQESYSEAVEALSHRAEGLVGTRIPAELDGLLEACAAAQSPASVQFAVESAVIELAAATAPGSAIGPVLGTGPDPVPLNAVVTSAQKDLQQAGARLRRLGFQAVKLKVGRDPIDVDVGRVRTLRRALGPDIALRLDANRAWTMEQGVAFSEELESVSLAYIEEPLADPSELGAFVERTGRSVALDETTRDVPPDRSSEFGPIAAVVLKPTLLGGIERARRWAQSAREENAVPIVSASYESGVGLRMLVALASALSAVPAGLSTYSRLTEDVLHPNLPVEGAFVSVDAVYSSTVDPSRLTSLEGS